MATIVQPRDGTVPIGGPSQYVFNATAPVSLTFKDLLALAGIDLEQPNPLTDGGLVGQPKPGNPSGWPRWAPSHPSKPSLNPSSNE